MRLDPNREIYIKPTLVSGSKGALAWWTSGENSKAMINTDRTAKPTNAVHGRNECVPTAERTPNPSDSNS